MAHPQEIILTSANVGKFPRFATAYNEGRIVADKTGRLRYQHGAPVGRLILARLAADGSPHYKEAADEWFDPGSQKALEFRWPE
jgi:hypothetical protein